MKGLGEEAIEERSFSVGKGGKEVAEAVVAVRRKRENNFM